MPVKQDDSLMIPTEVPDKGNQLFRKDLKEELDKKIRSKGGFHEAKNVLETIKAVCEDNAETATHISHEMMDKINTFHAAIDSLIEDDSVETVKFYEDVLETVCTLSDRSTQVKGVMVVMFSQKMLEAVLNDQLNFSTRMETVKSLNLLLEGCPAAARDSIKGSNQYRQLLGSTASLILTVGDYEFQVGVTEMLFRLIPKSERSSYASIWFQESSHRLAFLSVRDSEFETDCRVFLNELNGSLTTVPRVYSYPAKSVSLGKFRLEKPNDENYTEFWVDFNGGSERMTLFCNQEAESQDEQGLWETVVISRAEVISYTFKECLETATRIVDINLKGSARDLITFGPFFSDHTVKLTFGCDCDVTTAMEGTFGEGKQACSTNKKRGKASAARFPIGISTKDEEEVTGSEFEEATSTDKRATGSFKLPSSKAQQKSLHEDSQSQGTPNLMLHAERHSSTPRLKVSEPCVPMLTPTRYLISHSIHSSTERQKVPYIKKTPDAAVSVMDSRQRQSVNTHTSKDRGGTTPKTPVGKRTRGQKKVKTPLVIVQSNSGNGCHSHTSLEKPSPAKHILKAGKSQKISVPDVTDVLDKQPLPPQSRPDEADAVIPSSMPDEVESVIPESQIIASREQRKHQKTKDPMIEQKKAEKKAQMMDLKTQLMQTDPEYQDYPKKSVKLNEVYTPGLSTLSEESSNKNSKGDIGSAQKSPCKTTAELSSPGSPTMDEMVEDENIIPLVTKLPPSIETYEKGSRYPKRSRKPVSESQSTHVEPSVNDVQRDPPKKGKRWRKKKEVENKEDKVIEIQNDEITKEKEGAVQDNHAVIRDEYDDISQHTFYIETDTSIKSSREKSQVFDKVSNIQSKATKGEKSKLPQDPYDFEFCSSQGSQGSSVEISQGGQEETTDPKPAIRKTTEEHHSQPKFFKSRSKNRLLATANEKNNGSVYEFQSETELDVKDKNYVEKNTTKAKNTTDNTQSSKTTSGSKSGKRILKTKENNKSNLEKNPATEGANDVGRKSDESTSRKINRKAEYKDQSSERHCDKTITKDITKANVHTKKSSTKEKNMEIREKDNKKSATILEGSKSTLSKSRIQTSQLLPSQPTIDEYDSDVHIERTEENERLGKDNQDEVEKSALFGDSMLNSFSKMCKSLVEGSAKGEKPERRKAKKVIDYNEDAGSELDVEGEEVEQHLHLLEKPKYISSKIARHNNISKQSFTSDVDNISFADARSEISWLASSSTRKKNEPKGEKKYTHKRTNETARPKLMASNLNDKDSLPAENKKVKQVMKKKRTVESPDITCEESSDVESLYYEAKPKKKSKKRKGCNHNEEKENMKDGKLAGRNIAPGSLHSEAGCNAWRINKRPNTKPLSCINQEIHTPRSVQGDDISIEELRAELEPVSFPTIDFGSPIQVKRKENNERDFGKYDDFELCTQTSNITHVSSIKTPKTPHNDQIDIDMDEDLVQEDEQQRVNEMQSGFSKRHMQRTSKRKLSLQAIEDEVSDKDENEADLSLEIQPLDNSPLQPRKLFKPDDQEENIQDDEEDEEQEEMQEENQLSNAMDMQEGIMTLIHSFGSDLQRNLRNKKQQLDQFTKSSLKFTQKQITSVWSHQRKQRHTLLSEFKDAMLQELLELEKDVIKVQEAEQKTMEFLKNQQRVSQASTLSQAQRLKNLKRLQRGFFDEVQELEVLQKKQQYSIKDAYRKELGTLQKKILQQSNQHEIQHVKKSLQSFFM